MFRSFSRIFRSFKAFKNASTTTFVNGKAVYAIRPCSTFLRLVAVSSTNSQNHRFSFGSNNCILALSILGWLGFTDDDKDKESELIMTLKRSVLATQREQYDKAEQLLHVALRIAQQQQSEQGVMYCYDLMANVAFNRLELNKAEKLFVSVLQMLLSTGTKEDDLKVCCFYSAVLK